MPRLFISHSSRNDDWAIALQDWLIREGWSGADDIFLDLDPERGIVAGQRWARALEDAASRCEAVLFLVSAEWLSSKWCSDEYQLANRLNKKLFALLVDEIPIDRLPGGLAAQWQVVNLKGEPAERFLTIHPRTQHPSPVHIAKAGLTSLKRGLEKAGIGPETFELAPDASDPTGWRGPYRGLEALEPEDAAVFFGRSADIVRGIDALRGLAARKPPRLLVILGASGAGKSSFLRAGLWPRLARDDSQWLPLKAIRAGRGGAIEGGEGLLAALEEVHRRFDLRLSRAELRRQLATPELFIGLLATLRQAAARRALLSAPPYPLPVLCLDQGEEMFAADAGPESETLLRLARAAIDADAALLLVTIRSDGYGLMQNAKSLAGIDQLPLSLGPVPQGEIARIIREPSEVLRRKAGPTAPVFDAAVVEQLQTEIAGETDALPLLAFVLQRLMREHAGAGTIGVKELEQTGGVAAAIEQEAEAALADAGFGADRAERREVLRRLFIPRLARIDRESKTPQRRVARHGDLPPDLVVLARALTQRRLLVAKLAAEVQGGADAETATIEVAHEALLRRWPTLADLLTQDRDALLLLDGVLSAASDWEKAEGELKRDFLAHRGSRLSDAHALAARGTDWTREIAPARAYLAACELRESAERAEKEAALAREQTRLAEIAAAQARTAHLQRRARWALVATAVVVVAGLGVGIYQRAQLGHAQDDLAAEQAASARRQAQLDRAQAALAAEQAASAVRQAQLERGQVNLLIELATSQRLLSNVDAALRLSVHAARLAPGLAQGAAEAGSLARVSLAAASWDASWRLVLGGHNDSVRFAAFSPDGSRIVTASNDQTARVWDAATGKQLALFNEHESAVTTALFSPDGKRVVTASWDKTVRVWDASTGQQIAVMQGHESSVLEAAFSPDGKRVVSGSTDKTARIWDAATGKEIAILRGHDNSVWTAMYCPNGTRIVTASADTTARIWDVATLKVITTLKGHEFAVQSAIYSPDGARIVTASTDKSARVWDAATGKEIVALRGHWNSVWWATFSPDGTRVVTASPDKTARIWDAATGKEVAIMRGQEEAVASAAFSPDGSRVVTASWDHTARVWDAAGGRAITVLTGHENAVWSGGFSPDGARVVTSSNDKTARIWQTTTGKETVTLRGHASAVWWATFSPDGARVVTTSTDKTARLWDAATGNELAVLRGHEGFVRYAAFSADGSWIVTAANDKTARIWDAATGKEIRVLQGHTNDVWSAAFSPDGSRIVTASDDDTARVWDAATGKQLLTLREHGSMRFAQFSPDGEHVLTASADSNASIWDAATGKEIIVLRGHEDTLWSAVYNADGTRIVTASKDKTARIWAAASGQEIAVLRGHDDSVNNASFSPDGSRLITASTDKTARIWDARFTTMATKDLIADVCLRRLHGLTTLSRSEMRLVGYPDDTAAIDVCRGIE